MSSMMIIIPRVGCAACAYAPAAPTEDVLAAQTPDELIVSWVLTSGGKPWDLIGFDTGALYLVMSQTASA